MSDGFHRIAAGKSYQIPNGLAFDDEGNPIRTYCHSPVDDMEPQPDSGEFEEHGQILAKVNSWLSEARTVEELGGRCLGMLTAIRPDLASEIKADRALRSKWATRFKDAFDFEGLSLRSESNRAKMRERTAETWRKRKTPIRENSPPTGASSKSPTDQGQTLHRQGQVNASKETGVK